MNVTIKSITVAALMGISRVALADSGTQFTPVERLQPEQRQAVFEKISQMTDGPNLDWDKVAVGVDQSGNVMIVEKAQANLEVLSQPSSLGSDGVSK